MADHHSGLHSSFGHEDYRTEHQALNIQSGDRVLCITASGDRPLHLLLKECKEVIAIDTNASQSHLLELKKAALKTLDFESYSEFLGVTRSKRRNALWNTVKQKLPQESLEFWHNNKKKILKGILYQGDLERLCAHFSFFNRLFFGNTIKKLFQCDHLSHQKEILSSHWNSFLMNKAVDWAFHPRNFGSFVKKHKLHVSDQIQPKEYVLQQWKKCLDQNLAKQSVLTSLALKGRVDQTHLPPYLTKKGKALITPRTDRLRIETIDAVRFLKKQNAKSIDVFSLSDIASYMPKQEFDDLIAEMQRTAKPGARFCLRQSFSDHYFPIETLPQGFTRNAHLEQRLNAEDRCFVYRFFVGTIH